MRSFVTTRSRSVRAGTTLVEVMVAVVVLVMVSGGIFAALLQSRRLTEGSINQNSAVSIIQGYIEQMKNMEFDQLGTSLAVGNNPIVSIPTMLDESTSDPLILSLGTPPTTLPASGYAVPTPPTGAVDNVKLIDINNTSSTTADDLNLKIWLWVQDLTGTATDATKVKAITIIYTWSFKDGGRTRYVVDSVRSIRSVVPTY